MTYSQRAVLKSSKLLALMVLALSFPAWADDLLGLSGSVRGAYFDRDKSFGDDRGFSIGSVWLQARPQEVFGFKTYIDGRLQNQNVTRSRATYGDLREFYVEKSLGDFDFKVGRQITVWGRADKTNPTDVWSVRDYTLLTTDDEDQRTGLFAAQMSYTRGDYRLIALVQPEWRAPVIPFPELGPGVRLGYGRADRRDPQWGLKLDRTGGTVDWSVSYAQTLDRIPDLRVLSAGAGGVDLALNFQRIETFGADAATSIGSYGVRAEVAHLKTKDTSGDDPTTKNAQTYAVFGVDRNLVENLNLNVQYIYRHTHNYRALDSWTDPSQAQLAQQVNIVSNQVAREIHAASVRLSHKAFHETLESEVALVGWWNNGLVRPKVTYAVSDQLKAVVGAEFYGGHPDSFFGRLKDVSTGFVELRYNF